MINLFECKGRKAPVMAAVFIILAVLFSGCASQGQSSDNSEVDILAEIGEYKGYSRTVSKDEFNFYSSLVDDGESDEQICNYINEVNAHFYLGNKWGLCEPYSFDSMKYRMDQENRDREVKVQNGEVIYGPQSFTLESYFQYIYSNLESDLLNYIVESGDKKILDGAREYYEKNKSAYEQLVSITYKLTENGKDQTYTLSRDEMNTLNNSNPQLADFLWTAKEGEKLSYSYLDTQYDAEVLEVKREIVSFEENAYAIMQNYISSELFDEIIDTVAENNPVNFSADIY